MRTEAEGWVAEGMAIATLCSFLRTSRRAQRWCDSHVLRGVNESAVTAQHILASLPHREQRDEEESELGDPLP